MTQPRKTVSYILKAIVIISAAVGTLIGDLVIGRPFSEICRGLMYFTAQSNILIALICLTGACLMMRDKAVSDVWRIIKFVGTVAITLTGFVYITILVPSFLHQTWTLKNILTHVVVPIVSIADYFVTGAGAGLAKKNVIYVVIPPLLYAIYAGIGYRAGWQFSPGANYPYFFLNWGSPAGAFGFIRTSPYMGCAWWILALFIFLMIVGYGYLVLADFLLNRFSKEEIWSNR